MSYMLYASMNSYNTVTKIMKNSFSYIEADCLVNPTSHELFG